MRSAIRRFRPRLVPSCPASRPSVPAPRIPGPRIPGPGTTAGPACPVFAFGPPAGSADGPFSDAMGALGLEPGGPRRRVEILQEVHWSPDASRAAHAQDLSLHVER